MGIKLRKSICLNHNRIVIKLSSLAVTKESGGVDVVKVKNIISDIALLKKSKPIQIIIVSSGAINAGKVLFPHFTKDEMRYQQAGSAAGQPLLMHAFNTECSKHNLKSAQVLLTHEDLKSKTRSYNIRMSLETLLENEIIPIINENDTVSFDEISLGDNDQLSAMICQIMNADLLCMLTKADGLYDKNPDEADATHFDIVHYDKDFSEVKTFSKTATGKGGMETKLQAVRKLTPLGMDVIISTFDHKQPIIRSVCEEIGTLFKGNPKFLSADKAWILTRVRPDAYIKIDKGAYEALLKNASLLPIGVIAVNGKFSRGDSVTIKFQNKVIAHGISEYSAREVEKIMRLKSSELASVLTHVPAKVVIHKNNLLLKEGKFNV